MLRVALPRVCPSLEFAPRAVWRPVGCVWIALPELWGPGVHAVRGHGFEWAEQVELGRDGEYRQSP